MLGDGIRSYHLRIKDFAAKCPSINDHRDTKALVEPNAVSVGTFIALLLWTLMRASA